MDNRNSRRQFLQASGALMLGSMGSVYGMSDSSSLKTTIDSSLPEREFWQRVRSQFSFDERIVPMNAANLCPSFSAVTENIHHLTSDIDRDCSFSNRAKFFELLERSRHLVASQLNVKPDEIALVRNTSEANNIICNGLSLDNEDEVILWDQNHPTNNVAWDVRAARYGFSVKRVTTPEQPSNANELVSTFTSQFTQKTRVLSLTHVSNLSGIKLPISDIVSAAQERGIYVHVDGAQTWGAMALDLKALGVDSFSASAHKWYMGPKEVGLLYVKEANVKRIWPGIVAPGWGNEVDTSLKGARKFESLGQRNDAALAALGIAAEIHNRIGAKRIEERIVTLAQQLKSSVESAGLALLTPMDPALSCGVCIIKTPGRKGVDGLYTQTPGGQGAAIFKRLYSEFGISGAPVNGVRLCPTIYNTEQHIDRAVSGLKALIA